MKKAVITGITGQDGSYLAELLLEKGYEVHTTALFDTVHITHVDSLEILKTDSDTGIKVDYLVHKLENAKKSTYKIDDIICIDETSINSLQLRHHCYNDVGKRCVIKTNSQEVFKKYTGVFAISINGVIGYELYNKGGIDGYRLLVFLEIWYKISLTNCVLPEPAIPAIAIFRLSNSRKSLIFTLIFSPFSVSPNSKESN